MKPMGQKKTGKAKAKEIMTKTFSQWDARMSNILSTIFFDTIYEKRMFTS